MSNDANKGYKFTIQNGTVIAVYEIKNGRTKLETMDRDETWSVSGNDVIKTELDDGRLETTVHTDANGDGIFMKAAASYGSASPLPPSGTPTIPGYAYDQDGYRFDMANGTINAVYEIERGVSRQERIDYNESWSIQGSDVVKTEVEHGITETSVYSDTDGNGIYAKVSKTYSSDNGGTPLVWNDQHHGNEGHDRWKGSNSDDYYYGALGDDQLSGNGGNDQLYGGDGTDSLDGGAGSDDLYGGLGNDKLLGGNGDDYLYAGAGDDFVDAGAGNDLIVGGDGAGNDTYKGGSGVDTITYTSATAGIVVDLSRSTAVALEKPEPGSDLAGIGIDKLNDIENAIAGDFDDILIGSKSANTLEGGLGNDLLQGGLGKDTLTGGAGNDIFKFTTSAEAGYNIATRDVISDFAAGDSIDLSAIDAIAGNKTNDAFTFVGTSAALNAGNANGALWFDNGVLYGSNDKDLAAEFQIELTGVTELSVDSIVL